MATASSRTPHQKSRSSALLGKINDHKRITSKTPLWQSAAHHCMQQNHRGLLTRCALRSCPGDSSASTGPSRVTQWCFFKQPYCVLRAHAVSAAKLDSSILDPPLPAGEGRGHDRFVLGEQPLDITTLPEARRRIQGKGRKETATGSQDPSVAPSAQHRFTLKTYASKMSSPPIRLVDEQRFFEARRGDAFLRWVWGTAPQDGRGNSHSPQTM